MPNKIMLTNIFIIITTSILLTGCTSVDKQKENFTPDFIVNKYYEAVGGYEKLKSINTLSKDGHYIEPAYNIIAVAKIQKRRPNYRIIGDIDLVGFEEGYNGQAWEYHKGRGLILSEGEAKEVILVSSEFDYPFIDAEEKGHEMSYKGLVSLGGLMAHNIEVIIHVMNSEYITNFYFDKDSYLLIGQRKVMPIHAVGDDVEIIVKYSDYRNVNGVLYPFAQIERREGTGAFLNATIWSKIEANIEIPLDTFDPPSEPEID
ncbi:hypothetical protein [Leptobacterium sp. I13]|uniref:hypothetical protein n=1 Tax=Leptobacterium meishanense TaxID=3128904 RepID=UPI0030EC6D06